MFSWSTRQWVPWASTVLKPGPWAVISGGRLRLDSSGWPSRHRA